MYACFVALHMHVYMSISLEVHLFQHDTLACAQHIAVTIETDVPRETAIGTRPWLVSVGREWVWREKRERSSERSGAGNNLPFFHRPKTNYIG